MGNSHFVSRSIDVENWVYELTGVSESDFCQIPEIELQKNFFAKDDKGNVYLKKRGRGDIQNAVLCGKFTCVSLEEMMSEDKHSNVISLDESETPSKTTHCKLTFRTRQDSHEESIRQVDVCTLQALPENQFAMFQVASNLNAVEGISEEADIEEGRFLTDYAYDKTQGPAASISAGGAAIARLYCAFQDENGVMSRQRRKKQIEFLADKGKNGRDFCECASFFK